MSKKNLVSLLIITLCCLVCFFHADPESRRFGYVLQLIERRYYGPTNPNLNREHLTEAALAGMLTSLDDYSCYIPESRFRELANSMEQHFVGIGVELASAPQTGALTIVNVIPGSPACQALLKPGDVIFAIDGEHMLKKGVKSAVDLLKGLPNTKVVLSIVNSENPLPKNVEIVRNDVIQTTVTGDRREPDGSWSFNLPNSNSDIIYLRIGHFAQLTINEVEALLQKTDISKTFGIIIDLRDNPGGTLTSAENICSLFVDQGNVIFISKDKKMAHPYIADERKKYISIPIAVLVNRDTASASEIVASCIQDYSTPRPDMPNPKLKAVVIGERTYGKGTIQDVIPLGKHQGGVKMTIGTYCRSTGGNINRGDKPESDNEWGVQPNPGYEISVPRQEGEMGQIGSNPPEKMFTFAQIAAWRLNRGNSYNLFPNAVPSQNADPVEVDPYIKKAVDFFRSQQ